MKNSRVQQSIKTEELDRMCNGLLEFFQTSKIILTKRGVTVKETHELISSIAEIRSLLAQWGSFEGELKRDENRISAIEYLKECYLELEGIVKELRDDLHEARHGATSGCKGNE